MLTKYVLNENDCIKLRSQHPSSNLYGFLKRTAWVSGPQRQNSMKIVVIADTELWCCESLPGECLSGSGRVDARMCHKTHRNAAHMNVKTNSTNSTETMLAKDMQNFEQVGALCAQSRGPVHLNFPNTTALQPLVLVI